MNNDSPLPADSLFAAAGFGASHAMESDMTDYAPVTFRGIVKTVAAIEVEGIGTVYFQRPSLYYMGRKLWHADYQFEANGVRYYGTVWNRDPEIELRGFYDNGAIRTLPATAKAAWRRAIRKAALPLIDAACRAYCDAIEAGDDDNAERAAMGNAPKAVEVVPATVETVETAPKPIDAAETIRAAIGSLAYACGALDAPSFSTMRANLADLERLLPLLDSPLVQSAIANESAMRDYQEQADGELDTSHKPLNGYGYRGYQGQE